MHSRTHKHPKNRVLFLYLTGQGGNANGRLGENLRESGGRALGIPDKASGGNRIQTESLSGYDWYNNDVEYGETPRLIQSSEQKAPEQSGAFSMPENVENTTELPAFPAVSAYSSAFFTAALHAGKALHHPLLFLRPPPGIKKRSIELRTAEFFVEKPIRNTGGFESVWI